MLEFYQVLLWGSAIWVVLTTCLGEILDGLGDSDLDGWSATPWLSLRFWSLVTIGMGYAGWLLTLKVNYSPLWIFVLAFSVGVILAMLFQHCVLKPLQRLQSTSSHYRDDFANEVAIVTLRITPEKPGKIVIRRNETRYEYTAQAQEYLKVGDRVQIQQFEGAIACVCPLPPLVEEKEKPSHE